MVEAGEQAGALGARPCQCLGGVLQVGVRAGVLGRPARAGLGLAGEEGVGAGGGVLVVVQQPVQCLFPVCGWQVAAWSRA